MAAETAKKFEALEAQAQTLLGVVTRAGFEAVSPAIIQPAGIFLDAIGESLRARTYVFNDLEGDELCLRPDLTVPTCRLHLERDPTAATLARYAYSGTAFRFQPQGADAAHPREFRQVGIEAFGAADREAAEADIVGTIVAALHTTGLTDYRFRIGDLGLLRAVLTAARMPSRWRDRLKLFFWRPTEFRQELARLTSEPALRQTRIPEALAAILDPQSPETSEQAVAGYLETAGIEIIGKRSIAEITRNLIADLKDRNAEPLDARSASLIERYIGLKTSVAEAEVVLAEIAREAGIDMSVALAVFRRRCELLAAAGIDLSTAEFCAEFGRNLEYYTGFVFEIVSPALGRSSPIAGGGRYDDLLRMVGAPRDVPAVGAAIHTERLLAARSAGGAR